MELSRGTGVAKTAENNKDINVTCKVDAAGSSSWPRAARSGAVAAAVLYARRRDAPPPKLHMLPLLLALLALAARAEAQGLKVGGVQGLGAQRSYQSLSSMLAAASSFGSEYKQDKQGACSQDSESLCSKRSSFDDLGVLHLATSPQAFDARTKELVSPVRNQEGCFTCTSQALIGAAEAAVSAARRVTATNRKFSVQDFHFCASTALGEQRNCRSAIEVVAAAKALANLPKPLLLDKCMPYTVKEDTPSSTNLCQPRCSDVDPELSQGKFQYTMLTSPWQVQQHIRQWGGVITRVDIYDDFKPFFKANPNGIYRGPDEASRLSKKFMPHAVLLVGYNNQERYWTFKNSWGTQFAVKGIGKISFDAVQTNILEPDKTYGLKFEPKLPTPYKLCPHPKRRGCYLGKPPRGMWPAELASDTKISLQDLLMDNLNVIKTLGEPLGGAHVVLCGLNEDTLKTVEIEPSCPTPAPKCSEASPPQPVRGMYLLSKDQVGDKTEIRVAWGLPPGNACVREYKVNVLNLATRKITKQSIPLQNSNAAGIMRFVTRPLKEGETPPSYLFDITAANSAGSSLPQSLTVRA